jgi:hypothetical protein
MGGSALCPCVKGDLEAEELKAVFQLYESATPRDDPYYGACYLLENKDGTRNLVLRKETVDLDQLAERLAELSQLKKVSDGPANQNVIFTDLMATIEKSSCLRPIRDLYVAHDVILLDLQA